MKWLAKIAGAILMTFAVMGLVAAILLPFVLDPAWVPGYLAATALGLTVGVTIALGGYWFGSGRFLPEHDRWTLPAAAALVGVITADCTFFVYAMLVNRDGERPIWAIVVFVTVIVLVVVATVVHQVLYATFARRELARWPSTPTTRLVAGKMQKVGGVIHPVGEVLQSPIYGQPCVWWSLDVMQYVEDGGRLVLQTSQSVPFDLVDEVGRVRVELGPDSRARTSLSQQDQELGGVEPGSRLAAVLAAKGVAAGPTLSARVLFLRPGRRVAVLGVCRLDGGLWVLGPDARTPVQIAT